MKRKFITIQTIVIGCLFMAVGCKSSAPKHDGFQMPGAPRISEMPGVPQTSQIPGTPNTMTTPGAQSSPLPQSGFASGIQNHQAAVTREPSGVVQASYTDNAGVAQTGCTGSCCSSNGRPATGRSILPGGPILVDSHFDNRQFANDRVASGPFANGPFANGPFHYAPVRRIFGAAASAACGCNSCGGNGGDSCSNETAECIQGYAEVTPAGWNAFGVDPQEFICDGGDHSPRAYLNKQDRVVGLQPEDTVVHYTTDAGDIRIQPSNRTCVYSPRFSSVRQVTNAVAGAKIVGLNTVDRPVGPERVDLQVPGLEMWDSAALAHADVAKRIDAIRDRNRGVPVEGDVTPVQKENVFQLLTALSALQTSELLEDQLALISEAALAAVDWTTEESLEVAIEDLKAPVLIQDVKVEGFTLYEFPDEGRLRVVKMADKQHAQSGEEVGFAIRVQNAGDSPVNNVVINDNLISRLVYVEDSQKTDRETEFSTIENTSRSHRLEWKLKEELKVGESLLIEFKCRVR